MTKFALAALMLGLFLTGTAAQAATGACAADLQQLCPNQKGHALKQCRNQNHARFSTACKQSLAASNMKLKSLK